MKGNSEKSRAQGLCGIAMLLSLFGIIAGVVNLGNGVVGCGIFIGSAIIFYAGMIGLAIIAREE